jgi:hypothetical protein
MGSGKGLASGRSARRNWPIWVCPGLLFRQQYGCGLSPSPGRMFCGLYAAAADHVEHDGSMAPDRAWRAPAPLDGRTRPASGRACRVTLRRGTRTGRRTGARHAGGSPSRSCSLASCQSGASRPARRPPTGPDSIRDRCAGSSRNALACRMAGVPCLLITAVARRSRGRRADEDGCVAQLMAWSSQSKAAVQNTMGAMPSQCPAAPSARVKRRNSFGQVR